VVAAGDGNGKWWLMAPQLAVKVHGSSKYG